MTTLFLVRHGENTANLTGQFSHHKVDYPLTPKGILQASQTGEYLADRDITHIFCSPLKRARQTAEIIGERVGKPVTSIENFREVNVGTLELDTPTPELWQRHDAIIQAWRDGHPSERFPEGEDYHELLARARAGLETVLARTAPLPGAAEPRILIVGHGGIFTFTLFDLFPGIDPQAIAGKGMKNCSVTEFEIIPSGDHWDARLVVYSWCEHLTGEAALFPTGRRTRTEEKA